MKGTRCRGSLIFIFMRISNLSQWYKYPDWHYYYFWWQLLRHFGWCSPLLLSLYFFSFQTHSTFSRWIVMQVFRRFSAVLRDRCVVPFIKSFRRTMFVPSWLILNLRPLHASFVYAVLLNRQHILFNHDQDVISIQDDWWQSAVFVWCLELILKFDWKIWYWKSI